MTPHVLSVLLCCMRRFSRERIPYVTDQKTVNIRQAAVIDLSVHARNDQKFLSSLSSMLVSQVGIDRAQSHIEELF